MIFIKCKNADMMPSLSKKIDDLYRNSDYPTRTQTEEAFGKMFDDMLGDLKYAIYGIGMAVVVALLLVAGNAMAMAMRERTTEVAVLKAIGFPKGLVLFLVLTEAVLVAGLGGAIGDAGQQGVFRLCRHRPVHGRVPAVLLRVLEHRDLRPGRLALRGFCQRLFPGALRRKLVRDQWTEEGGLKRHDPDQVQRPQPAGFAGRRR